MKTDNVARLELVGRSETARRVASSEAGIAAHSGRLGETLINGSWWRS